MNTIENLFKEVQSSLGSFFKQLNYTDVTKVFGRIKECKGLVFFTGVGKSSLIAQKIAVTLTSTGTRAFYLSPTEALHGDVGLLSKEDLLVVLSKSGETEELLNLIPFARNKGVQIVGVLSNDKSRIARACDLIILLPVDKELCPFNLVPTTSSLVQMIFGDVLAVALMQDKQFSLDEYAMNHPAGSIGKRVLVRVSDLMLKNELVPTCLPSSKLLDSLVELSSKRAGCVLIVDAQKKLLGIFTDGDLRRSLQQSGAEILKSEMAALMTLGGRTVGPDELAWEAMKKMEDDQKFPIMVLPVVDQDRHLLGLIKMHDILQAGL